MKAGSIGSGRVMLAALAAAVATSMAVQAGEVEAVQAAEKGTNVVSGAEATRVVIETSLGTIKAELWPDKSPGTVSNFLKYADDKFYDGVVFHRVIKGFMIQGGAFVPDMRQKRPTYKAIKNEGRRDVKNQRGTFSMARTDVLDSATSQFFINLVDNGQLDQLVYCVFGKVTEGMDVVDAIAQVKTGEVNGMKDVPLEPVTIKSVSREKVAAATAVK